MALACSPAGVCWQVAGPLQRVRGDIRDKALDALWQLIGDVDAGRFRGLMLVATGTPGFFDGPQGAQRLPGSAGYSSRASVSAALMRVRFSGRLAGEAQARRL
jgi:P-loop Domain of unknown function (DUF2791)